MNIDKFPNVNKRLQTPVGLANEAWHFANTLAAGKWRNQAVQEVEVTRRIIEKKGSPLEVDGREAEPIFTEIMISFSALKQYLGTRKSQPGAPLYTVTSTASQVIEKDAIPANVLEEIFEDASEEGHPLHIEPEETDDEDNEYETDLELIDDFEIERTEQAAYTFDHKGAFEEYTLSYFYSLDGDVVHESAYASLNNEFIWNPIKLGNGPSLESRPFMALNQDEANVDNEVANMDTNLEKFLTLQEFNGLTEFSVVPEQERIRRVLRMISKVSSGFVDLRKR